MNTAGTGNDDKWTLIVSSKPAWFNLHLKDVWRYRDLIGMFVKRDFTQLYKQTILGPLWFVVQPALTTIMFMFVFGNIAHINTGNIPGPLFYLSGLTVWNHFASCLSKTSSTFLSNSNIFGKVYFPRLVAPISTVISTLVSFFIQFGLFLIMLAYFVFFKGQALYLNITILLLPYLMVLMAGLGLGIGIIISSLTTKYRDLTYLVGFAIQLLMYLTPVIFPLSSIHGKKRLILEANPMTAVIETFRHAFFPAEEYNWHLLIYSSIFMLVTLTFGILLFTE